MKKKRSSGGGNLNGVRTRQSVGHCVAPLHLHNTQTYRPPCANALVKPSFTPEFGHCRRWSGISCYRRAHICKYAYVGSVRSFDVRRGCRFTLQLNFDMQQRLQESLSCWRIPLFHGHADDR